MDLYDEQIGWLDEGEPSGADGRYIRDQLMPEFWTHFANKAKDYNDSEGFEPHKVLGLAGQFAEIWRKVWKLKKSLWSREPLIHEQPREVLLDMIGNCFLALAMIDTSADPNDVGVFRGGVKVDGEHFPPPRVAGEPWQGRTKRREVQVGTPEDMPRPSSTKDPLWPNCGRERCIAHPKVPYSVLEQRGVTIYPGKPLPGTVETVIGGDGKPEIHNG